MKGGYNGVRDRNGDLCPSCDTQYDRYIPADDHTEPQDDVERVCVVVNYGNHASGGYVHFDREENGDNNLRSRETQNEI